MRRRLGVEPDEHRAAPLRLRPHQRTRVGADAAAASAAPNRSSAFQNSVASPLEKKAGADAVAGGAPAGVAELGAAGVSVRRRAAGGTTTGGGGVSRAAVRGGHQSLEDDRRARHIDGGTDGGEADARRAREGATARRLAGDVGKGGGKGGASCAFGGGGDRARAEQRVPAPPQQIRRHSAATRPSRRQRRLQRW